MLRVSAAALALAAGLACTEVAPRQPLDASSSARRGITWLLAQREAMEVSHWLPMIVRVYRVVDDEETAASLAAVIRETLAAQPLRCEPAQLDLREVWEWGPLFMTLMELVRCRHEGRDIGRSAAALERSLAGAQPVWREPAGQRLVLAYLLERLGIPAGPSPAEIRAQILGRCRAALSPDRAHPCELYPLTHVVLIASDYFQRYLDPAGFSFELQMFREALRGFRQAESDDLSADIVSEILFCYKLLRQPLDPDARALRDRLVSLQNPDGSWGSTELRTHLTAVATLALVEFAPELRTDFGVL